MSPNGMALRLGRRTTGVRFPPSRPRPENSPCMHTALATTTRGLMVKALRWGRRDCKFESCRVDEALTVVPILETTVAFRSDPLGGGASLLSWMRCVRIAGPEPCASRIIGYCTWLLTRRRKRHCGFESHGAYHDGMSCPYSRLQIISARGVQLGKGAKSQWMTRRGTPEVAGSIPGRAHHAA